MRRTRIKICGVTNVDDAVMAAELGADAIGMVFHPASARCVEIDAAAEIAARVPAFVACVGLFVDARTESIAKVLTEVSLQGLQLHGDEKPADARDLLACRSL